MQTVTKYPNHTFSWLDMHSTDPDASKAFYCGLFDWTFVDEPIPGGSIYTMFQLNGHDVAAMRAISDEQKADGHPSYWSSYISCDDIDATVERAKKAGAQILMPVFDVMDAGRMTMMRAPGEEFVALWEAKNHIGAKVCNIPGSLIWNELMTRDVEKSTAFYVEALGWEASENDGYTFFTNNGRGAAGMMPIGDTMEGVPPHWGVYFAVENMDESIAKLRELGGRSLMPPFPSSAGIIAPCIDPQGASFTMIQSENADPMP